MSPSSLARGKNGSPRIDRCPVELDKVLCANRKGQIKYLGDVITPVKDHGHPFHKDRLEFLCRSSAWANSTMLSACILKNQDGSQRLEVFGKPFRGGQTEVENHRHDVRVLL